MIIKKNSNQAKVLNHSILRKAKIYGYRELPSPRDPRIGLEIQLRHLRNIGKAILNPKLTPISANYLLEQASKHLGAIVGLSGQEEKHISYNKSALIHEERYKIQEVLQSDMSQEDKTQVMSDRKENINNLIQGKSTYFPKAVRTWRGIMNAVALRVALASHKWQQTHEMGDEEAFRSWNTVWTNYRGRS